LGKIIYRLKTMNIDKIEKSIREIMEEKFKDQLLKYFHQFGLYFEIEESIKSTNSTILAREASHWLYFINEMKKYDLENFNWNSFCERMNQPFKDHYVFRKLYVDFFIFYVKAGCDIGENSDYLRNNVNILVSVKFTSTYEGTNLIAKNEILSHYPMLSKPQNILHIMLTSVKNVKRLITINFNTESIFIKCILKEYINYLLEYSQTPIRNVNYRQFFYYFGKSFVSTYIPDKIEDFNIITFNKQYRFYKKIKPLSPTSKSSNNGYQPLNNLKDFYLFLIKYIRKHNINYELFNVATGIDEIFLSQNEFCDLYEKGFRVIKYSAFEAPPLSNRFYLNPNNQVKFTISCTATQYLLIDLSNLNKDFSDDIKEWLWLGEGNIIHRKSKLNSFLRFLEFSNLYKIKTNDKLLLLKKENNSIFNSGMILSYVIYLKKKYTNTTTINSEIKKVKAVLKYLYNEKKEKYKIENIIFTFLREIEDKKYGGNPIQDDDMHLIIEEFMKLDDELIIIIFNLSVATNIRIGEVFSLERDCIDQIYENGDGVIKLRRKGTMDDYQFLPVDFKVIGLIEKALLITEELLENLNVEYKNLIFIKKTNRNKVKPYNQYFQKKFLEVYNKISGQLKGKYTAYNLRHTFINLIVKQGVENGKSYSDIAQETGNSPEVFKKHYVEKESLRDYLEVMSETIINDVDINGRILNDDSYIAFNQQVKDAAGACDNDKRCDDDDDGCLHCPSFITTLDRIPIFEHNIKIIRYKMEEEKNIQVKKLLDYDLQSHVVYLNKMYQMKYSKEV